jgi:hypothetical protein
MPVRGLDDVSSQDYETVPLIRPNNNCASAEGCYELEIRKLTYSKDRHVEDNCSIITVNAYGLRD